MPAPSLPPHVSRSLIAWVALAGAIAAFAVAILARGTLLWDQAAVGHELATGGSLSSFAAQLPSHGPLALAVLASFAIAAHSLASTTLCLGLFGAAAIGIGAWIAGHACETNPRALAAAAIAFNPGLMLVNSLFGPFELAAALLVLIATVAIARKRWHVVLLALVCAIGFAPASVVALPLALCAICIVPRTERMRVLRAAGVGSVLGVAILWAASIPFAQSASPTAAAVWLFAHYPNGLSSYHFNSAGAFNFHVLFGSAWRAEDAFAGPLQVYVWGYLLLAGYAALILGRFVRGGRLQDAPIAAALLMFGAFMFPARVLPTHFAYTAMLLPLAVGAESRLYALVSAFALTLAINTAVVAARVSLPFVEHLVASINAAGFIFLTYGFLGAGLGRLDLWIATLAQHIRSGTQTLFRAAPRVSRAQDTGMSARDYGFATASMSVFVAIAYFKFWTPPKYEYDEAYYIPTVFEYLRHVDVYEQTHPPLSKLIMVASVLIGGDDPFGWRLLNFVIGTLLIGVVYLFAKRWLHSTAFATVAALIVAFDGFHFVQARIATPEITVGFFSMLVLYLFYRFWLACDDAGDAPAPSRRQLAASAAFGALCGFGTAAALFANPLARVCIGTLIALVAYTLARLFFLATSRAAPITEEPLRDRRYFWCALLAIACGALAASKWNGLFTIAAIFVLFAFALRRRFAADLFYCGVLAVTGTIYLATYIPYLSLGHPIDHVIDQQIGMYRYHANLVWTHPYESHWWQWPLLLRPIPYYIYNPGNNKLPCCISEILALPNPLTWWLGLVSLPFALWFAIKRASIGAIVICTAYLAQWLPWARSPRAAFEYHFYPNAALIALANALLLQSLWSVAQQGRARFVIRGGLVLYGACAIAAFIYWYPILAGVPISLAAYHERMLHWLLGNGWM